MIEEIDILDMADEIALAMAIEAGFDSADEHDTARASAYNEAILSTRSGLDLVATYIEEGPLIPHLVAYVAAGRNQEAIELLVAAVQKEAHEIAEAESINDEGILNLAILEGEISFDRSQLILADYLGEFYPFDDSEAAL